jgi:hypothetical protein
MRAPGGFHDSAGRFFAPTALGPFASIARFDQDFSHDFAVVVRHFVIEEN